MPVETRTTLREVADRAGVSSGTASAVFSHSATVSDEARSAVLRAAAELNYRPRRRTPDSAKNAKATIGLVVRQMKSAFPTNPFYSHVLHGAQRACAAHDMTLSYELLDESDQAGRQRLPLAVERREVQGLVLLGYFDRSFVEAVLAAGVPCVLVDNWVEDLPVDSVHNADSYGGYQATRHLLELGHLDPAPAIITGPAEVTSVRERVAGYQRALAEFGVTAPEGYLQIGDMNPAGGATAMAALQALPKPPTAVFCCNDATALGALEKLRELGVQVPGECSVVGYDDIDTAAWCSPPLTTVATDKELMGAQAVWHLMERMRDPRMTQRETRLSVSLIRRGSTARR